MAVTRSTAAERVQTRYRPLGTRTWPIGESLWLMAVSIVIAVGLYLVFEAKSRPFGKIEEGLASGQLLNLNDLSSREELLPFLNIVSDPTERQFVARTIYNAAGNLPNVGALARMRVFESQIHGARGL